jgi:hypothetical protein
MQLSPPNKIFLASVSKQRNVCQQEDVEGWEAGEDSGSGFENL